MLRRSSCAHSFAALIAAWIGFLSESSAVEIAPQKYPVVQDSFRAFIPYKSSHSLTEPNRQITRVLFSIHSSGFEALDYYDNAQAAVGKVPGAVAETLIIAPQFLEKPAVPEPVPEGLLYWRVSPFRGSSQGAVGGDQKGVRISAFDVLDQWLSSIADRKLFPQLKDIALFGHSGGGQFVQRYAMVGKFEPPTRVKCRFVVSAPSSYAYPSQDRFNPRTNKIAVPDAASLKACPDYNKWGYGLESPYEYFSKASADAIAKGYAERYVFYLCGAKDSDPNDPALGKSCGAMMQGRHRLERMQVFVAYLRQKYGETINRRHSSAVVPNVGHFGRGTMTSVSGLKFLFAPLK